MKLVFFILLFLDFNVYFLKVSTPKYSIFVDRQLQVKFTKGGKGRRVREVRQEVLQVIANEIE